MLIAPSKSGTTSPISTIDSNSSSLLSTLNNEYYYRVNGSNLLSERRGKSASSKKTAATGETYTKTDVTRIPFNLELLERNSKVVEAKCLPSFWKNYILV